MARTDGDGEGKEPALVRSVDRAVTVLEIVAARGEIGITELADELGVHKSTASRLVAALARRGLLEQKGDRGRIALGFGVVRLAAAATGSMDLARLGQPTCQQLAEVVGETVNLAVHDGEAAINVAQEFGTSSVTTRNWVGRRTPLHATSAGKVLLAYMNDADRRAFLRRRLPRYTESTITEAAALRTELARVIDEGNARSFEELEAGLHAVAVPVWGAGDVVVAALSAAGPSYRLPRRRARAIVPDLRAAAEELSTRLGWVGTSS
jgi:IclR family transcriptional regulator, acetate operon repressor